MAETSGYGGKTPENFEVPKIHVTSEPGGRGKGTLKRFGTASTTYIRERGKKKVIHRCEAGGFSPKPFYVDAGEDIAERINGIFNNLAYRESAWILTATGYVSSVTMRQPYDNGGTYTVQGRYHIISLSGSSTYDKCGKRISGMSIQVEDGLGSYMGGAIAGPMIAATRVLVAVALFNQEKEIKTKRNWRNKRKQQNKRKRSHSVKNKAQEKEDKEEAGPSEPPKANDEEAGPSEPPKANDEEAGPSEPKANDEEAGPSEPKADTSPPTITWPDHTSFQVVMESYEAGDFDEFHIGEVDFGGMEIDGVDTDNVDYSAMDFSYLNMDEDDTTDTSD